MKMKGILTNCVTSEEKEVELEYLIELRDGKRIFSLLNGVTGWESFCIDSEYSNIEEMKECGWLACAGTPRRYDKLFISAEEMKKAFIEIEKILKSTLIIQKQKELKNLIHQIDAKRREIDFLNIGVEKIKEELGDEYDCEF